MSVRLAPARSGTGATGFRALRFARFGGPEVLELAEQPRPVLREGEALVALRAASINPSDVKNVQGRMAQTVPPRTPGRDFAGVVVEGPPEWRGRAVWGTGGDLGFTRDGTHGEMLLLPAVALAEKPAALSFEQAGAVGVNYVTAWLGLIDYAALAPGETVLVFGATGGVGGAVCALARRRGARVIAAVRGEPEADAVCRQVGAELLDVAAADVEPAVRALTGGRGVDIVFDTVGVPPLFDAGLALLALRGRYVVIAGRPQEAVALPLIPFYRREARLLGVDSLKRGVADCAPLMAALAEGFESGAYPAPVITAAHDLAAAPDAYAAVAAGTRGRVILTMQP
jgi:NADPH:quinone reductase-like Zn-dependent oxidoreductase